MPLTRVAADALGVLTICLVVLFGLLGLLCVLYSYYFRTRIHSEGFVQLGYFSGPWITRITFIFLAIWWGLGEIIRLNLLRRGGRVLDALNFKWQETVCKCYIVSNLGFAEPCLFLTLVFLLRASLQETDSGTLSRRWNRKTVGYVLLYCLPLFVLQLVVILIGPEFNKHGSYLYNLPHYFTRSASTTTTENHNDTALCTYPLFSTIFLGVFAIGLTIYLFWLGRRILKLVINKGLQKRVYTLIFSVSGFFPLRVLFLGLSVLSRPESILFEALAFLAFLSLLCCAGVGVCMLVYCPVADSLALRKMQDIEARRRISSEHNETISLIANQNPFEESIGSSHGRNSGASMYRGSISFRAVEKEETSGAYVELSLFSPSQHSTPPESPGLIRWPMLPQTRTEDPY